jgi:hypothetical protein
MTPKAFMAFFLHLLSSLVELNSALAPAIRWLHRGVTLAGFIFEQCLIEVGAAKLHVVCCAGLAMTLS